MHYKQYFFLLTFSFLALISCDNTNDFDQVCGYFDSLEEEIVNREMSSDDKFKFIYDHIIKNLSPDSPAKISFDAVIGYVPVEGRYALYIDAAESTLHKNWKCESMDTLLQVF